MAGAQLGSFTYDMVLDYAKFEDAFTKAQRLADQRANQIKRSIQGAVDGIGDGLKDIAGKVAAAFAIDKMLEFGKQAIETADQLGKASQKIGLSVESLSSLSVTAKLANVSMEDLQGGMEKFSKIAAQAAGGNKEAAAAFKAIGVSVKDANGNVRSMQDLLGDTAGKFASYGASITKTADAQAFFGKSGANLIPFLNDLGKQGFAGAREEAEKFGAVISTQTAKQAEQFNDNLSKLGIEAKGFANAVVAQLLPSLDRLSDSWVEAGKTADGYNDSATTVANGAKYLVLALIAAKEIISAVVQTIVGFYDAVKETFSAAGQLIDAFAESTRKSLTAAFHLDKAGMDAADAELKARVAGIGERFAAARAKITDAVGGGWTQAFANATAASDALFDGLEKTAKGADHVGKSTKEAAAPLIANAAAADAAAKAHEQLNMAFAKDAEIIAQLGGKLGPLQKMYGDYIKNIIAANDAYQHELDLAAKSGKQADDLARAKANLIAKTQANVKALQEETKEFVKQNDSVQKYLDKVKDEESLIGLTDRQKEITQAIQEQVKWWDNLTEAQQADYTKLGILNPTLKTTQDRIAGVTAGLYDQKKAFELNTEAAKGWQSIWVTAGNGIADTFAKVLVNGGSLMKGLKDLAKQTVEQIIAYFAKLAIINPILNSIFGSQQGMGAGFQLLPTMANTAFGGGGGTGGAVNALINSGGSQQVLSGGSVGATGSAAGGGFQLFSPSSWLSAGKNLWNGFFGGSTATGFAAGAGGAGAFTGSVAQGYTGAGAFAGSQAGASIGGLNYGGYGSALGQGIGVAGGVFAGVNEFKAAGGGAAGVAGGLAYGVGTYFAGAGVSAALAGGLSAGLAAIPVVGWIAIAAMLIDKFSGGKLFGTAWSTKGSTTSLSIGAGGGDATAFLSQSKQGALFSGTKYRNKTVDPGKDAQDAAQQLFDSVQKIMVAAAHKMQTEVPPVIQAALDIVNTYDKKGKVTSTKYVVDILGKKYEEASQELAATRISAEAIVATVAASEAGKAASAIAEQWRGSADLLMEGANFLVTATADINQGINLLGDGGTLTDIAKIVTDLQQGGEKLVDTYARLGQESAIMRDALALTGVDLGKTGAAFVTFADGVANAAGGVQNLAQMVQTFNQAFFSPAELAAANQASLKKASDSALGKIGENPLESMAQFKADFLAALPTLTPEQLEQWYAAGAALATYTSAVTDSASQIVAAKQKYAQFEMQLYGDDFISSFASIVSAEQQQIDTANQLAKAAGLAGASQEDLARIMAQGSLAVGQALAKLSAGIQQDVAAIYGAPMLGDGPNNINVVANNKAALQAQAAATQAGQASAAYDLIQKIGDFAFASGKSTAEVLKQFGLTPDQLAKTLGTTADQVTKQIDAATKQAAALTTMSAQGDEQTGLLQDILATLQGKTLPYDISQLGAIPSVPLASAGKLGGPNSVAGPGSSRELAQAVGDGTKTGQSDLVKELRELNSYLRGGIGRSTVNRNTAGGRQIFVGVN
jgi:hypothetical protein